MHSKGTTTQNTTCSKQFNHRPKNSPFDSPLSLLAKKKLPTNPNATQAFSSIKKKQNQKHKKSTTIKRLIRPTP
jgi:hypothetical protein